MRKIIFLNEKIAAAICNDLALNEALTLSRPVITDDIVKRNTHVIPHSSILVINVYLRVFIDFE